MNWLIVYSIIATIAVIVCGVGWYMAHSCLKAMADIEPAQWLQVRAILRTRILGRTE